MSLPGWKILLQISDNPAGVSCRQNMIRNILGNHASGTDNTVFSDGNAGIDYNIASYPDIVSDYYRISVFQSLIAAFGI